MRKLSYTYVKEQFERRGYILLSNEYINSKVKLEYRCQEGHEHSITWNDFQKGSGCPICNSSGRPSLTYNYIFNAFYREGYKLLDKEYKGRFIKLNYICPVGHRHNTFWSNWQQGYRCPYCHADSTRECIDNIRKEFESEGYILLSTVYKNIYTKLYFICPNGHRHNITLGSWRMGRRCGVCNGNNIYTIEEIKKDFENYGYTLLTTEYKDAHSKLEYICPVGHRHSITRHGWKKGQRCPTCAYIKLSGEGSPHWRGGASFEPYCEVWKDKEYKRDIRERDGNICLNPYCYSKNPNDLTIHHIDYNKKNCHPSNLITVCRSCNSAANKDREWHKAWYQAIIKNRYKYNH